MKYESRTETAGYDDYDIDIQACSTTDCTGLIPMAPLDDAEVEHYNELYRFVPECTDVPTE